MDNFTECTNQIIIDSRFDWSPSDTIKNFFASNNILMFNGTSVTLEATIATLFQFMMEAQKKTIDLSLVGGFAMIKFKYEGGSKILPLITSRWVIYYLRMFGVKCVIDKKPKELCDKIDAFMTDIVFTGKSDIDIPELKEIAEACSKVKLKLNPWMKEDGEPEEQPLPTEANARFRGAEWFEDAQKDVTLIGAGGLGSNIAVSLCRVLGNKTLYIYDDDIVEQRNLAGQNFGISDIGKLKCAAVKEQAINFNPLLNVSEWGRFAVDTNLDTKIVITGLDNMATRQLVYSKWEDTDGGLLIDARLSAEKWQIFCLDSFDTKAIKEYRDKWLFNDDEAEEDVCSYKQTAFAAQMCASYVTNLYINWCSNLGKQPNDPLRRYVPFMTEYDASQMILRFKDV